MEWKGKVEPRKGSKGNTQIMAATICSVSYFLPFKEIMTSLQYKGNDNNKNSTILM